MADPPTGPVCHRHGPSQEVHRVGALQIGVIGGEVLAEVAERAGTEHGIHHGMGQDITVGGCRDPDRV